MNRNPSILVLLSIACAWSCAGHQAALTDVDYFECNQKGLTIVSAYNNCDEIQRGIQRLIREDPTCSKIFGPDASVQGLCDNLIIDSGAQ